MNNLVDRKEAEVKTRGQITTRSFHGGVSFMDKFSMLNRTANKRGNAIPVRASSRKAVIASGGTQSANRFVGWENLTPVQL